MDLYRNDIIDNAIEQYLVDNCDPVQARELARALYLDMIIGGVDRQDVLLEMIYNEDQYSTTELLDAILLGIISNLKDSVLQVFDVEFTEEADNGDIIKISEGLISLLALEQTEDFLDILHAEDLSDQDKCILLLGFAITIEQSNLTLMLDGNCAGIVRALKKLSETTQQDFEDNKENDQMTTDSNWIINYVLDTLEHSVGAFILDYGIPYGKPFREYYDMSGLIGVTINGGMDLASMIIISSNLQDDPRTLLADIVADMTAIPAKQAAIVNDAVQCIESFKTAYSRRAA